MILVYAVVPALVLCLIILYVVLIRRFFLIKSKIPVLGLRGALGRTAGKRRRLAALGVLQYGPGGRGFLGPQNADGVQL